MCRILSYRIVSCRVVSCLPCVPRDAVCIAKAPLSRSLSGALAKNIAMAYNLMQNMGKYALLVGLNYYGALQC